MGEEPDQNAQSILGALTRQFPGVAFNLEPKESRSIVGTPLFVLHYTAGLTWR
jgi:hypothetical protein